MSRMKSVQKPPLAKSPIRLRSRRPLQPCSTPSGSLMKSLKPNLARDVEESELGPEYLTISCELRALAKKVQEELGNGEREEGLNIPGAGISTRAGSNSALFERGRFYDEYSARRNERLKRKKGQTGEEGGQKSPCYNLGVTVESAKRSSSKKLGSLRKSISVAYYTAERTSMSETPRYMLRSMSKENKKPPLPVIAGERKVRAQRVRKTEY
ncbi:hypothetical protein TIFTF001_004903 [Ficus carica]|uniref:Uncharacterized protein n=1 Tax=Ficus carica TaxID=3494 RepID=A0AA88CYM2_FICCA|nr:hypothetical protein TIFTF001_004903 [Ficus carica]